MNNARRKLLYEIQNDLENLKDKIEMIMDDEQSSFDNLNEGLQSTMRGAAMEEAIDNMDMAMDSINEAIQYIDDATI